MVRVVLTSAVGGLLAPLLLGWQIGAPSAAGAEAPADPWPAATAPSSNPDHALRDDVGTWSVSPAGPDTWTVTWQSSDRFPVAADRPTVVTTSEVAALPAGAPVGVPTIGADGRTVEVTVASSEPPTPESLDVVLSGEVLDETTPAGPSDPSPQQWTAPVRDLLPVDPGAAGTLPITTTDYRRPGLQMAKMRHPVEMRGHVVKPADEAADPTDPLVVFLHGRHSYCYDPATGREGWRWPCRDGQKPIPSHLGYDYVQRLLASQGYVTVSISANGINAQDGRFLDGGAGARSRLVQNHLDLWASELAGDEHQVDLDKVVLVGHSRGGEGVSRASLEIPLGAPYTVVGQVLIGPTNFGRQTTPYVPTVTVLPSCDGDVHDLQGQAYTDLARGLATGDTALKSSVMAVGANHNFFNTEWTPGLAAAPASDDWGAEGGVCGKDTTTRLTAAEQRRVGKAYVAGAVHLFAAGDQDYRPMFDGSAVRVGSTKDAVVLSHMVGGDREIRLPDGALTEPVAAATGLCEGTTPFGRTKRKLCGRHARAPEATPHWPAADSLMPTYAAFEMSWQATGAEGGLVLDTPIDLTGREWLDLRTVVDPRIGDVRLRVRLTDVDGTSTEVDPAAGRTVVAMPHGDRWTPGKYWAQTLRVDTADLMGVDTSAIASVELLAGNARGRLWVLDLAAVSATLPAVPAKRVPIVDLGRVRVDEGGDGSHVAEVPFRVTGSVTEPAELWVYGHPGFDETGDSDPVRIQATLPPGSGSGTFEWSYPGDELDSYPRIDHQLFGHAIRDVMLRDNQGLVVVVDDDPSPQVSVRAGRGRVPEGDHAEIEVTLSAPFGYETVLGLSVVAGDGSAEPVRAHDVGRRWLDRFTSWRRGTDPALHELRISRWAWLDRGDTSHVFRIPLRDDAEAESRESLTVRVRTDGGRRTDPVTVYVRADD